MAWRKVLSGSARVCSLALAAGLFSLQTADPAAWVSAAAATGQETRSLLVPGSALPLQLHVDLPPASGPVGGGCQLEEFGNGRITLRGTLTPAWQEDGLPRSGSRRLLVVVPPRPEVRETTRRFTVRLIEGEHSSKVRGMRFVPENDRSLALWDGTVPVWVYHHGLMGRAGVPEGLERSGYLHPLHGLDGEVLTDDFPEDHYHHRGLFWAWPHIQVGNQEYDLWLLKGIASRFERWLGQHADSRGAVLGVENGWYAGDRKVMTERVWITVHAADSQGRMVDLECFWIPVDRPVTLAGAEGKSYGGVTLRYAPRTNTVITTPLGQGPEDLAMTRLPWADLSATFAGAAQASGVGLFIRRDHPDYPPTWLTRHYGALCVGWPGVAPRTFQPGTVIRCRYRLWIHRGTVGSEDLAQVARALTLAESTRWE